ncbi:MAG: putative membrane protein [Clostridia bacterium 62_21]|nr:MAG: putative membrane protein [Clostridia bacterium 62_21]
MRKFLDYLVWFPAWLFAWLLAAAPAAAQGIAAREAQEVSDKLVEVLNGIIQPLGALVIFAAIAYTAFKMVATANKPQERAEALSAIPYILGGGIALGAVMLLAGFVVNLMQKAGQ